MQPQRFRLGDQQVVERFIAARAAGEPPKLNLAWSTWGFGRESIDASVARLARHGVPYIELHGDHYGPNLGTPAKEILAACERHGVQVAGVCGMVSVESELSATSPAIRQRAIDYFRRQAELCREVGGTYVLFAAGAVGRPVKYDDYEVLRATETARIIAEYLHQEGVIGALEPVRRDEVSLIHTIAEARAMLDAIDHPGVAHLNPDLYHMLAGEDHIGLAILEHGELFASMHLADTNRRALGSGHLDLDVVIMGLHAVGHARAGRFVAAEPLGAGSDPYEAMHALPDTEALDALVGQTASTWREREEAVLGASDDELRRAYGIEA